MTFGMVRLCSTLASLTNTYNECALFAFQMITLGGDAELELVDSLDPFTEGIVFSVRPPKKSWKNISNLSGGEKTLSSLALVFALHYYKPTPLVSKIFSGIGNTRFSGIIYVYFELEIVSYGMLLRLQVLRIKDFLRNLKPF